MDGFDPRLETRPLDRGSSTGRILSPVFRYLTRRRYQVLGGFLFAAVLPGIIYLLAGGRSNTGASYHNTLLGSLFAVALGFLIYQKVTTIPRASAVTKIIPIFVGVYGALAVSFLIYGVKYNYAPLSISMCLAVLWFEICDLFALKLPKPKFGYVGRLLESQCIGDVKNRFDVLASPQHAENIPRLPSIADFRSDDLSPEWENYLSEVTSADRPLFDSEKFFESTEGCARVSDLVRHTIDQVHPDSIYIPVKKYIDTFVALIGLAVLMPLLVVLALIVKIDSPGPVFFVQERVGYRGKAFQMIKFRSMIHHSNSSTRASDITLKNDPRITRVGRFLRVSRLDELPQLLNVLWGDMSIIGPRPETRKLSQYYGAEIPNYKFRHVVRPGITGWAQVRQGHVTDIRDVHKKLEFDFFYVKNMSIWLDLLICLKTVKVMITGRGAK
ncbi:MAG: sugar transferase [Pseudomonadota bacterium]